MASFQARMALPFLIATFGALLCHVLVLARGVSAATEAAGADAVFAEAVASAYYSTTVWTLAIVGPSLLVFSILMTFRFAGPLYRIRRHLREIADGEQPGECRLRDGDELQDLCDVLNRAVARLRGDGASEQEPEDAPSAAAAVIEDAPSPLEQPVGQPGSSAQTKPAADA